MAKYISLIIVTLILNLSAYNQVSIINSGINSFNVTPASLANVNFVNGLSIEIEVMMTGRLVNADGDILIEINSFPFTLEPGFNASHQTRVRLQRSLYGSNKQANYIKNTKLLPSGIFQYCYSLIAIKGSEPLDDNCDQLESNASNFLMLIYPGDGDTIESKTPVLTWTHSEAFNLLLESEQYRMTIVEKKEGQNASEAISNNSILFREGHLNQHQVQYPFGTRTLEEGKTYAWQVEKIVQGVVTNMSEVWVFSINKPKPPEFRKYAVMKPKKEATLHTLKSNLLYFSFKEDYASSKGLEFNIYNDLQKLLESSAIKDNQVNPINLKKTGNNQFVIDLSKSGLVRGMYTLEIFDEKGNKSYLKFYFDA